MASNPMSSLMLELFGDLQDLMQFISSSQWIQRQGDPEISDFVMGNPHEMPLEGFPGALAKRLQPENPEWFAYKMSEPEAVAEVVRSLRAQRDVVFEAEDVNLTTGAFAGLLVCMRAVLEPGDEVVFISPPWFFYSPMIKIVGGNPVRVTADPPDFALPHQAVAEAITERTRAVIVNTPHNPSGRIYRPEELQALSDVLTDASRRNGRTIYLLSDEAYCRIVYDGREYHSPTTYYPSTFLIYTYGKTLLTPGARIGYVAMPPTMPDREALRPALLLSQITGGWLFPNALLQYALGDLELLAVDVGHLQAKRDRMTSALTDMGYELTVPEGTFYVMVRSPLQDDVAFAEILARHEVYVLPGRIVEQPGWFRISLTANDDMIDRGLPGFELALKEAASG
jgi:aspartate aminotransferase